MTSDLTAIHALERRAIIKEGLYVQFICGELPHAKAVRLPVS